MTPRNEPCEYWQVHYAAIRMRSEHLLRSSEWADCTFQFQTSAGAGSSKVSLDAHKLILAMASPVFAAMFYGDVGDKESPVIISDIDLPTFSALLEYIYTDEPFIPSAEAAISLYKAANKYILVHLEHYCLDYLFKDLNPNNVCRIYEFACFFENKLLEKKCLEVFSTKTQSVLKSSSFLNANTCTVKTIVSMDTLDINSEMDLYNALLDYIDNFKRPDDDHHLTIQFNSVKLEHGKDDQQTSKKSENALYLSTKKSEEPRQILHGIIEQIRFLSITPTDLAKISENTRLLSKDEICALFTNMFSPNSSLLMPEGFSCIREPRFRDGATIRHTVHNATTMPIGKIICSAPCYVRKLTWSILAQRRSTQLSKDFLGFHLVCKADSSSTFSKDWYCHVRAELRLLSANPNDDTLFYRAYAHKFSRKENCKGYLEFIEWSNLTDPENYYIKDDSFTLEVHFITELVQGINL